MSDLPSSFAEDAAASRLNSFSTSSQIVVFCYHDTGIVREFFKRSMQGFQGVRDNME